MPRAARRPLHRLGIAMARAISSRPRSRRKSGATDRRTRRPHGRAGRHDEPVQHPSQAWPHPHEAFNRALKSSPRSLIRLVGENAWTGCTPIVHNRQRGRPRLALISRQSLVSEPVFASLYCRASKTRQDEDCPRTHAASRGRAGPVVEQLAYIQSIRFRRTRRMRLWVSSSTLSLRLSLGVWPCLRRMLYWLPSCRPSAPMRTPRFARSGRSRLPPGTCRKR